MSLTLEESARRCGHHCWVERRLFEVLGGWAASAGATAATLAFDRHSLNAAWRAGQWWERLPVLAGVDRDALVAAPPGWDRLLGAAGSPAGDPDGDDVTRLALAYRVALPRLLAAYRAHRDLAGTAADGAVLRTLGQAAADAGYDGAEGEALLQARLRDAPGVEAAAAAVRDGELALLGLAAERPAGPVG